MKDGVDKGFCLSYWKLSYRRKFLRNSITAILSALVATALYVHPEQGGFVFLIVFLSALFAFVTSVIVGMYTFIRWQTSGSKGD